MEIETEHLTHMNFPYGEQIYNGLDCAVTLEVLEALQPNLHRASAVGGSNMPHTIYQFERALQAPALEMMLRGLLVDPYERDKALRLLDKQVVQLLVQLDKLACAAFDRPYDPERHPTSPKYKPVLNPGSPKQLLAFFYDLMELPKVWSFDKGQKKLSMNRDSLEKLQPYFYAAPFVNHILAIRDLLKQKQVLETEIDADGRMRTSYNVAGTETGRWSSSSSSTGTGTNLQNIAPGLRGIFIADEGWKFCGIDLEQAESREVGWLCGTLFDEWSYYDACLAGDLHTTTCKLIWTNRPWPGDPKADKALAEQNFYREYSYRDMSKRGGHGSNYYGKPPTMARHLKVKTNLMVDFQKAYFAAYPGIPKWHAWVAQQLQTKGQLTTVFGRTRHFFGRATDDTTLREAIAFCPQSATGDRMNLILWRLWKHMGHRIRLVAQVHDAVYFMFREDDNEAEVVAEALSHFRIPIFHSSGRELIVPGEAKTGWSWSNYDPNDPAKAPNGLKKFKGSDTRVRHRPDNLANLLDSKW